MEKIEVKEITVEIKSIFLGGKKLTKSTFNQVEHRDCFDKHLDFIGDEYFGYVKDKDNRYLLWNYNGRLRKTNISNYSRLPILTELSTYKNIEWFLVKCYIKYDGYDDRNGRPEIHLENETKDSYNNAVNKVNSFITEILKHQIYI